MILFVDVFQPDYLIGGQALDVDFLALFGSVVHVQLVLHALLDPEVLADLLQLAIRKQYQKLAREHDVNMRELLSFRENHLVVVELFPLRVQQNVDLVARCQG